jgi:hypothetical protein
MARPVEFDTFMHIRVSTEFVRLVDRYARSKKTTSSAFTRAALLAAMREDGLLSPPRTKLKQLRERELV